MKNRIQRVVVVLLGVTLVLSISPGMTSSGGFVKFGPARNSSSGQWAVPLDLTFNGHAGLAGLQMKIVALQGAVRLEEARRGERIASAGAWGFDYSVTRGGDTMIVLFWSRNLGSLNDGTYPSVVNISVSRAQPGGPNLIVLADVQSVLADGQDTSANVGIGSPASVSVVFKEQPREFISQNFPNPCNPSTVIRYFVPEQGQVTLKVYSTLGQEVRTVLDGETPEGQAEVTLTLSDLPSGTYFYRFSGNGFDEVHKILLLRYTRDRATARTISTPSAF